MRVVGVDSLSCRRTPCLLLLGWVACAVGVSHDAASELKQTGVGA